MAHSDCQFAIVTGGGTGLGRAIALALAHRGYRVLVTGRRAGLLEETAAQAPNRIDAVAADISAPDGRERIAQAIPAEGVIRCLIHNAGVLDPVGPLRSVQLDDWRTAMAINVEGPVFLTQALLPKMERGGRIAHIGSGAAHKAMPGWGAYCAGKAALHMVYQVYREELHDLGVLVGSVRPGVVDTPMQDHIRRQSPDRFPAVKRFIQLKESGQLHPAEDAAAFAVWALLDTGDREYAAAEWDIGNPEHYQRWQSFQRSE